MPERLRSALYVDFDNIFGGLLELDRDAAIAFANDVTQWLERWRQFRLSVDTRRDLLVQRAYLNPSGWVEDSELGNESGRLYLQRFRPNLVRAGFEVIDCPAVTRWQKNAADIRIVIDVMLTLEGNVRYDEVLIASSDSDFTPLLHVLRARGRRIGVLSAGDASAAYKNVAHLFVGPEQLISLVRGLEEPVDDEDEPASVVEPNPVVRQPTTVQASNPSPASADSDAVAHVLDYIARSDTPVYLSDLGASLHKRFREQITETGWFGRDTLGEFLRAVPDAELQINKVYVWDPNRHEPPLDQSLSSRNALSVTLPAIIERVCQETEMPRLSSDVWMKLFDKLAEYARDHQFNLNECTAWVRDELRATDVQVGRQSVGFVVKSALMGGVKLNSNPPPDAKRIRDGFVESLVIRAESQGAPLDDETSAATRAWLVGQSSDAVD